MTLQAFSITLLLLQQCGIFRDTSPDMSLDPCQRLALEKHHLIRTRNQNLGLRIVHLRERPAPPELVSHWLCALSIIQGEQS